MNTVQIVGNLTRDPQMRTTKTGQPVASLNIAVNRLYTTPTGEKKELTDFVNVVAWRNLAEAAGNQLRKGARVFVEGRYSTRSYEGTDGQKRYVTEVIANMIAIPLGTTQKKGDFSQFGQPVPKAPQAPAYSQGSFGETPPASPYSRDEELPF